MKTKVLFHFLLFFLISFQGKAQLTGEWKDENGACYKIRQIENQIFWYMDSRPRVINVFSGYMAGNTITGQWADLPGGNMMGSGTLALRIENQNRMVKIDQTGDYGGSVWTRGGCADNVVTRPDLSGDWYDYSANTQYSGRLSKIEQNGDKLVFLNTFNMRSDGYFIDNTTVIATAWEGGLRAVLEDNGRKIVWTNGSVWQRTKR